MKKLSLNLDDLQVESFATTDAADGQEASVHGYARDTIVVITGTATGCNTQYSYSCGGTCMFQWTCGRMCDFE